MNFLLLKSHPLGKLHLIDRAQGVVRGAVNTGMKESLLGLALLDP